MITDIYFRRSLHIVAGGGCWCRMVNVDSLSLICMTKDNVSADACEGACCKEIGWKYWYIGDKLPDKASQFSSCST